MEYDIKLSTRPAKPRSIKFQGFGGGDRSTDNVATDSNGSVALAKLNSMFVLIDADGNEVSNVDEAAAVLVNNGLSLASKEDIVAFFDTEVPESEEPESGSGASKMSELKDVLLTDLKDKQILVWNAELGKWVNSNVGSGATGDGTKPTYTLSEIVGAPTKGKMEAWDDAADKRHSHNNLTNVLQKLTVNHLKWLDFLCNYASYDSDGNIAFEGYVISKKDHIVSDTGTSPGGSGSTGGGESGGEGSGGGYEDGGGTGGGTTTYTYRIVFNANGGSTSASTITFATEDTQSDITREHVATKSGDTFIGWAATSSYSRQRIAYAADYGGVADSNGVSAKNTEGIWTINTYCTMTGGSLTTSGNVKTLTLYAQWLSMSGNESSGSGDWVLKTVLQYNSSYYSYEGDGIVYHFDPNYFNGVDAMKNKTAKKVKFYTSTDATTNVKIYLVDDTTKNVLQTISVSGARGEEISLPGSGILIESGTHLAFSGNGLLRGTTLNASAEYYGGIEVSEVLGEQKSYNYVPMIDFYLE